MRRQLPRARGSIVCGNCFRCFFSPPALARRLNPRRAGLIVVHGGAGVIERANFDAGVGSGNTAPPCSHALTTLAAACSNAAALRWMRWRPSSREMEDDPLFNAGRGAVFTAEGKQRTRRFHHGWPHARGWQLLRASRARAIPISCSRAAVMERSPHVMLIGEGAEAFARSQNLEAGASPSYFFTEPPLGPTRGANLRNNNLPIPPQTTRRAARNRALSWS